MTSCTRDAATDYDAMRYDDAANFLDRVLRWTEDATVVIALVSMLSGAEALPRFLGFWAVSAF